MFASLNAGFVVAFITGSPGSGKSYALVRDVVERLIGSEVKVLTNLPLKLQAVAEYVAAKRGCEVGEVLERIDVLTPDTLAEWKVQRSGPWSLPSKYGEGWELILDECHNFCKRARGGKRGEEWERWLGEVRHERWLRIVFVSQDKSKVGHPITEHAEIQIELTSSNRRRDPYFAIPLGDWYELLGSITGVYEPRTWIDEYRRVNGKLRCEHSESFTLDPWVFELYESYSTAGGGAAGHGGVGGPAIMEYQRRPKWWFGRSRVEGDKRRLAPTWLWFSWKHPWALGSRALMVAAVVWMVSGGMGTVLGAWLSAVDGISTANTMTVGADGKVSTAAVVQSQPQLPSVVVESFSSDAMGPPVIETGPEAGPGAAEQQARGMERERLKNEWKVVMLAPDRVEFSNGYSVLVGDGILEGPYLGQNLQGVDLNGGTAVIGDVLLVLGQPVADEWLPSAEPSPAEPASIPGSLPAVEPSGGGAPSQGSAAASEDSQPESAGSATAASAWRNRSAGWSLDSGLGSSRLGGSDPLDTGTADSVGAPGGRETQWRWSE